VITIKTTEQIELLRVAGKIHREVLGELSRMLAPGVSATMLDEKARELVREQGGEPSFLGYRPDKHTPKFPASLCVSINDTIVHGIPKETMVIHDGDIVSLDLGVFYQGVFVDGAVTVPVGKVKPELLELLDVTREALMTGIEAIRVGNHIGDIGHAIEYYNAKRYGNVRELAGHGVGLAVHEEPFIPNYGKVGTGAIIKPGMVLAIEPMFNLGTSNVVFHNDGYTVTTADGLPSAHFEHTVLVTDGDPEILT